jgi:hypothetical protein
MASGVEAHENEPRSRAVGHRVWVAFGLAQQNWPGRYTALLLSILVMIVVQPAFQNHMLAEELVSASMSLVLLAALYTLNISRTYFTLGAILMVPPLVGRWVLAFYRTEALEVLTSLSAAAFVFFAVVALVWGLFRARRVTLDSIAAAICAYLLMGVGWGFLFAVVALEHPGSFSSGLLHSGSGGAPMMAALHNFIYYSFVCLTTTGYGDIAPISGIARVLSILESVAGQMYLAVLIARLVSLEVAQSMMRDR